MSNRASEHLFELIKSLSGSEKRYFKLFADRHHTSSEKLYSKLFDAIDKQEEYDEEALLKRFKGQALTNHFSVAKNRLYHQILKSLDSFYAMQSIESELSRYLHYSEILFQKALYQQCFRTLRTAQKIALKHEKWEALIQILRRQKRLLELDNYEGAYNTDIKGIYEAEQNAIQHIRSESELWHAKSSLLEKIFTRGKVRSKEAIRRLETEIKYLDSHLHEKIASVEARYLINQTKGAFHFALGEYQKSKTYLLSNAELLESNITLAKDEPTILTSVYANLIYVSAKLNQFEDVERYLNRSRQLPKKLKQKITTHHAFKIFISTYSLELAICRLSGNINRAPGLISETLAGVKKWDTELSEVLKASFYHSISSLYFIQSDFKNALKWNNDLLNSISINTSEDQYLFAHMFHLIIHLELGNHTVIMNTLERIERQLQKRRKRFKFEEVFSNFMRSVSKRKDESLDGSAYEVFAKNLKHLEGKKFEAQVFEYFDFLSWARSKIENRSFHEILAESAPDKDIL
jgi:hypothetical protein